MSVIRPCLAVLLAVALGGCSSMEVSSEYEKSVDFSSLKTYSWTPPKTKGQGSSSARFQFLDAQVRAAVERELAAKGYEKRSHGTPDFFIRYYAWAQTHSDSNELSQWSRWQYPRGPVDEGLRLESADERAPLVSDYDEGTLLLIVTDGASQRSIWRGTAKARLIPSESQEKQKRQIDEAVTRILAKFPPR
jgi:hypothetical protein